MRKKDMRRETRSSSFVAGVKERVGDSNTVASAEEVVVGSVSAFGSS